MARMYMYIKGPFEYHINNFNNVREVTCSFNKICREQNIKKLIEFPDLAFKN